MSKRLWTGLLVGLLSAMALVAVGVGAFHAGERHEITTVAPVVGTVPGETVRVIADGRWGGHWGGPPFGFLFPLLFLGLIVLLFAGRRQAYWGRPWGSCGRDAALADWHQRAHIGEQKAPPGSTGEA